MRQDRLTTVTIEGPQNSLHHCFRAVPRHRVIINFLAIWFSKYLPSFRWKNALYRWRGVRVERNVAAGLAVTLDIFWPEKITLGENCLLGYNVTILAHEFLIGEYRLRPTTIGKNVMVGANATILAGVTIGDGSVIGAGSVVAKDIPPGVFAAGVPAKIRRNLSTDPTCEQPSNRV